MRHLTAKDSLTFTGEARKKAGEFNSPLAHQQKTIADCNICLDTGQVSSGNFCWCSAGIKAERWYLFGCKSEGRKPCNTAETKTEEKEFRAMWPDRLLRLV